MCSFYGWSIEYVESLPHSCLIEYSEAITVLEAQSRLVDMNVVQFPKMSQTDRNRYFSEMKKVAHPIHLQPETSFEDYIKAMTDGQ